MAKKPARTTDPKPEAETPSAIAPDPNAEASPPSNGEAVEQEDSRSRATRQHRDSAQEKVEISAARDPYRRAGLALGKNPLIVPIDDLDDDQREALEADPNVFIRAHRSSDEG